MSDNAQQYTLLPPKILHNHCLQFFLRRLLCNTQEKYKQKFGAQTGCIMGDVPVVNIFIYTYYWPSINVKFLTLYVSVPKEVNKAKENLTFSYGQTDTPYSLSQIIGRDTLVDALVIDTSVVN